MAEHIQQSVRQALVRTLPGSSKSQGGGVLDQLSGARGMVAGASAAMLLPLAAKAAGKLDIKEMNPENVLNDVRERIGNGGGSGMLDAVTDQLGGKAGMLANLFKKASPLSDEEQDDDSPPEGVGTGRRMPVQQSVDIGAPIEQVYNRWIRFEDWPSFMHRVNRVTQDDETTIHFTTKIWGKTKEFTAQIETQRPMERVRWRATEGISHSGVVTFHEIGPSLTRVLLNMDVDPSGPLEKAARGMRHVKRAARADLHRFKAMVEMTDEDVDAWPGRIENGEVVDSGRSRSAAASSSSRTRRNGHGGPRTGSGGSASGQSNRARSRSRNGHGR